MQVYLNVYDVTNTANENTNGMITRLNSITRELNFGGVFHGAIQLEDLEWSFGYCESGTGVYCCRAQSNSLYTFREHIELGVTHKTKQEIREILSRFKREWPGTSYDLLQRNCCHFCEEFCVALKVPSPPAWLNRFAQGADATVKFTNEASALAKRVSSNISTTAQQSAIWLRELSQRVLSQITIPAGADSSAASSGDEVGEDAGGSWPYARSTSPSPVSEPGTSRRDGSSVSRLTSRLRTFGNLPGSGTRLEGGGHGGAAAILPASTPSSCSELSQCQSQSQSPSQLQWQLHSLPLTLRQKWQELDASAAGDGTKQFLFGLIKTRQARLATEDNSPSCGAGSGGSGGVDQAGEVASGQEFQGYSPESPPQVASCPAGIRSSNPDAYWDCDQAPSLQVMQGSNHTLLSVNVVGGMPGAAEAEALQLPATAVAGAQATAQHTPAGGTGCPTVEGVGTRPGAAMAAAPVRHLLDM